MKYRVGDLVLRTNHNRVKNVKYGIGIVDRISEDSGNIHIQWEDQVDYEYPEYEAKLSIIKYEEPNDILKEML